MSLLERYILRGSFLVFVAALFGLTAIIWITQALRDFDLMTTKGQTLLVFLRATGLVVPSLVMVIAPIALFGAVVFTLNRLNADSELIVMSASGISHATLMKPFAILTVAVTLLVGSLSLWLMPWSFGELRNVIMKVRADFLTRLVREGQFTNLDKGLVFHYRERAPGGGLNGIFIQDRRDPADVRTYIAESGINIEEKGMNFLVLEKGSLQRQTQGGRDPIMVAFKSYQVDLAQFGSEGEGAPLKPRERGTLSLLWPDLNDPYVQRNLGAMRAELHDRIVNPLYALVFGMVGFAALAKPRTTRQGRGMAIIAGIAVAIGLRVGGFALAAVATKSTWAVWLLYGIAIAAIFGACWFVFGEPLAFLKNLRPRPSPQPVGV
jgi:lipopolysaccharide export system permease protein